MMKIDKAEFINYYNSLKEELYEKLMKSGHQKALNRFEHSIRVSKMAGRLVKKYYPDDVSLYERALIAGLIHDFAKYDNKERYEELIKKYNIDIKLRDDCFKVYHGLIGYLDCYEELNITDDEILKAIKYHVMGHGELTFLQEVIYLADFIEDGRIGQEFEEVRKMAFIDFKKAIAMESLSSISYLINRKVFINPDALDCYNAYIKYLE